MEAAPSGGKAGARSFWAPPLALQRLRPKSWLNATVVSLWPEPNTGISLREQGRRRLSILLRRPSDTFFLSPSPPPFKTGGYTKISAALARRSLWGWGEVLRSSGRLRRAPKWMRAVGLEWFFRLIQRTPPFFTHVAVALFCLKIHRFPTKIAVIISIRFVKMPKGCSIAC